MQLKTLDLFCGGGGSGRGASNAGAEIVCAIDAWNIAAETYKANFPDARVVNTKLDENSDISILGKLGEINLILASPECTNHTCAKGNRPRDENSKKTARYVLNFARTLKPRWLIIENVIQMRRWHGYDPLIMELEGLGYHVSPEVLDASEFGVPQTRKRLFLLCDREKMPAPVVRPVEQTVCTAEEVIQLDGPWQSRPLHTERRAKETIARADRAIDALGKGKPFLIVYYGSDGSGGWQPLGRPLRTLTTLDRFGLVTWEDEAPMLRMLQVPELKRAMGFDGLHDLPYGTRRDQIRILGNGVCPPVMEAVVRSLTQ